MSPFGIGGFGMGGFGYPPMFGPTVVVGPNSGAFSFILLFFILPILFQYVLPALLDYWQTKKQMDREEEDRIKEFM